MRLEITPWDVTAVFEDNDVGNGRIVGHCEGDGGEVGYLLHCLDSPCQRLYLSISVSSILSQDGILYSSGYY